MQMTIFDVLDDMDAKEREPDIYDSFEVPGVRYSEVSTKSLKGHMDKIVVDSETGTHLFGITIKQKDNGNYLFRYSAMDRYWGGSYQTADMSEIRRSICIVSEDIRKDWVD